MSLIRFVPKSTELRISPDAFQKENFILHKDSEVMVTLVNLVIKLPRP